MPEFAQVGYASPVHGTLHWQGWAAPCPVPPGHQGHTGGAGAPPGGQEEGLRPYLQVISQVAAACMLFKLATVCSASHC